MINIDILVITAYLLITLIVGLYKGLGINTVRDYAISHRNYGTPVLVATIFGTYIGGGSTIGVTETVFNSGFIFLLIFLTDPLSKIIMSEWVSPRIARFYNMISVGDIMATSYGKTGKMTSGLCGFTYSAGLLGVQVSAFGYIFHYFTGMDSTLAIILAASIVVFYAAFGGVKAVTATDVIQFCVIVVAIPIIANVALMEVGGYKKLFQLLPTDKLAIFPPNENPLRYILLFIFFLIPWLDPAVTQRLLMAKNVKQLKSSLRIAAILDVPCYLIMGVIALCTVVLAPEINGKLCFPYIIGQYMPIGLKGLAIAGMLATIMSTADSYLNAAAVSFVHDFIKPIKTNHQLSDKQELFFTRLCTLLVGAVAIFAALNFKSIMDIILDFSCIWAPIVAVPLYAILAGLKTNERGFRASVIAAVIVFILFKSFSFKIEPLIPAMLANAIFLFIFSFKYDKRIFKFLFPKSSQLSPKNIQYESKN